MPPPKLCRPGRPPPLPTPLHTRVERHLHKLKDNLPFHRGDSKLRDKLISMYMPTFIMYIYKYLTHI